MLSSNTKGKKQLSGVDPAFGNYFHNLLTNRLLIYWQNMLWQNICQIQGGLPGHCLSVTPNTDET